MAYKIAVCEDCETDRAYLGTLIREWAAKTGRAVQVSFFPSAESFENSLQLFRQVWRFTARSSLAAAIF